MTRGKGWQAVEGVLPGASGGNSWRAPFADWLRAQTYRDDPVGDLARDLAADPMPPAAGDPAAVVTHVAAAGGAPAEGACLAALREWEGRGA